MSTNTTPQPQQQPDGPSPNTSPDPVRTRSAELTVSVDGDQVLVHGTTRTDTDAIQALKASGFRWFRSLGVWGLPRSYRPETRLSRIAQFIQLMSRLDRTVTVEDSGVEQDAAERRAARDDRLDERADRLTERAARNRATADGAMAKADRIYTGYNGQPILADHHSANRHRRDLERADSAMRTSLDAAAVAADQQRRADQIREHLERGDHPVTIKLRIQRAEAELRRLRRSLLAAQRIGRAPSRTTEIAATARAQEIDLDRAVLAELAVRGETRDWGADDFQPGDLVRFHGLGWYEVRKVNKTTLTVPSHVGGDWTDTVTYAKVDARSRAGVVTTARDLLETPVGRVSSQEPQTP